LPEEVFQIPLSPKFSDYLLKDVPEIMKTWDYFVRRKDGDDDHLKLDKLENPEI